MAQAQAKKEYAEADLTDPAILKLFGWARKGNKIVIDDKSQRVVSILSDEDVARAEKRGAK